MGQLPNALHKTLVNGLLQGLHAAKPMQAANAQHANHLCRYHHSGICFPELTGLVKARSMMQTYILHVLSDAHELFTSRKESLSKQVLSRISFK